jgi:dihydrodipicolinate synthase/N-acetylneuraminate lyase
LIEIAANLGLPIGVYSIPDVSGVRLTANATAMLVAGEAGKSIVAAKITEANYDNSTLEYLNHPALARLKIVQGWDPFIARALKDGKQRVGDTSGPMSFAVFQYVHILAAAGRGQWDEAAAAQDAVTRLFAAMQDDPGKFADLQRAKFVMGLGQPLTGEVQAAQVERLFAALESLPRPADRARLARSLDLMQDGPYHARLAALS